MEEKGLIEQAHIFLKEERWQDVIDLLGNHLQDDSLSIEGLALLAQSYSKIKSYDNAISIYTKLSEKQPRQAKWFRYLGDQYYAKGIYEPAIDNYKKCLLIYPKWILVSLKLGECCEYIDNNKNAIQEYRNGIQVYKSLNEDEKKGLSSIYAKLCTNVAKLLLKDAYGDKAKLDEAERLFNESTEVEPESYLNWYWLGKHHLERGNNDEALKNLENAKALEKHKDFIIHGIAQAYLRKGNPQKALEIYETIPKHKRVPYIFSAMSDCLVEMGKMREAATMVFLAIRREPKKFYHHYRFAQVLIKLGDRDQAIEELKKANECFRREKGEEYNKALKKIEEIKDMPSGEHVTLVEDIFSGESLGFGQVVRYYPDRGFGFIKDDDGGKDVFFHIKRVKGRLVPTPGDRAKFLKEIGEKGLQASRVWLLSKN